MTPGTKITPQQKTKLKLYLELFYNDRIRYEPLVRLGIKKPNISKYVINVMGFSKKKEWRYYCNLLAKFYYEITGLHRDSNKKLSRLDINQFIKHNLK